MCKSLFGDLERLQKYLLADFYAAREDRVINVRMAISDALFEEFRANQESPILQLKEMQEIIDMFMDDSGREIRLQADQMSVILVEGEWRKDDQDDLESLQVTQSTLKDSLSWEDRTRLEIGEVVDEGIRRSF
mmetsp:Transcript_303/g.331  ORF Transcript_303/g.331 Transcript_303/m.331 type:complete len:133 (+) Transcript_303:1372-1770(+)